MKLSSDAFKSNEPIPLKFSGYGDDINPQLIISDVSQNARSLVLIIEDPDSPGKVWQHWLVWNIPADTSKISEGSLPMSAIEGTNDFGKMAYGGPMPHSGTHHYHFKLYAMKNILELPHGSNRQQLDEAMKDLVIDSTELIGLYTAQ